MIMNSCRIIFPTEMISACLGKCSALDASSFSTPTSLASSFCSSSTQDTSTSFSCSKSGGGGLSRSRKGVSNNLSALGGNAFDTGTPRQHQAASNKKCGGAKEGWGYFVDAQSAWRETLSVGAILSVYRGCQLATRWQRQQDRSCTLLSLCVLKGRSVSRNLYVSRSIKVRSSTSIW